MELQTPGLAPHKRRLCMKQPLSGDGASDTGPCSAETAFLHEGERPDAARQPGLCRKISSKNLSKHHSGAGTNVCPVDSESGLGIRSREFLQRRNPA